MYHLITIGDAVIDTHVQIDNASIQCGVDQQNCQLCFDYASKIPISGSFQCLGGNATNVAVGATRLGLNTAIFSSVGNDSNGEMVIDELRKYGVNTSFVDLDIKSQTRYSIVLNYKSERTILSYHAKRKYVWPQNVPPMDWIYYTSLSEGFEIMQRKLINFLDTYPTVRLAINPGSYQIKNALKTLSKIFKKTDILFVNLEEAEKIACLTLAKAKTISAIIHKLLEKGVKEVVITDSIRGAWAGNTEEIWHMETYPVEVVSKTGAGDAFSAGYLSARFYNHDLPNALAWGTANSCGTIVKYGPHDGLLEKKQIKKMIAKFPKIKPKLV